jgi:hypothetical protein
MSQILEHLQTVYGRVSPQMLENREQELRTMLYTPKFPIDMVYNAVKDFVDYAALSGQPVSQLQTIAKAYVILNKTGSYKQPIIEWNCRPIIQKTWINFKDHFFRAHQGFRETTDVTLEESELVERNNANLVQQVDDGLSTVLQDERTNNKALVISQMANSTAKSQSQLTAQLAEMQKTMVLLQAQVQNQQYTPTYTLRGEGGRNAKGYRGGQGGGGRSRGNQQYRQRNYSKYCWTHGACGHIGSTCNTKLAGHQDTASFTDKMGGSTNNCPPT